MPAHRMNLKGPWDYEWLFVRSDRLQAVRQPAEAGHYEPGRIKMPAEWRSAFGDAAGTVRFRRRFGCPTNLDLDERVSLVFDGVGGASRVSLNGRALGSIPETETGARFEITELLQPRNELTVEVDFDPTGGEDPGGLWGPVALEIRTV